MEEAKETERKNIASLKKYEQFELEKKKKREKINVIRKLKPPYISTVDGPNGKWVIVPDIKKFVKPERVVNFYFSSHIKVFTSPLRIALKQLACVLIREIRHASLCVFPMTRKLILALSQ